MLLTPLRSAYIFFRFLRREAWRDILDGDINFDSKEYERTLLLREVPYGPEPRVVQTQPVFRFDVMVMSLWLSKLVYAEPPPDQVVVRACLKKDWSGRRRELATGKAVADDAINLPFATMGYLGGRFRSMKFKSGRGDGFGKEELKELEAQAGGGTGFEVGVGIAKRNLGLLRHRVFTCEERGVRAVVFYDDGGEEAGGGGVGADGGSRRGRIVVAFRGSKVRANFASDARFFRKPHNTMRPPGRNAAEKWWRKPMVHGGFLDAFVDSGIEREVQVFVKGLVDGKDVNPRVLVVGHSLGGALAQLCAYSIATSCDLKPDLLDVYTFGCPGLCNVSCCRLIEEKVPGIFNVVSNTDFVYYVGKYASRVFHPGIPVHINKIGDIIVRPTYIESSLRHFWWRESITVSSRACIVNCEL